MDDFDFQTSERRGPRQKKKLGAKYAPPDMARRLVLLSGLTVLLLTAALQGRCLFVTFVLGKSEAWGILPDGPQQPLRWFDSMETHYGATGLRWILIAECLFSLMVGATWVGCGLLWRKQKNARLLAGLIALSFVPVSFGVTAYLWVKVQPYLLASSATNAYSVPYGFQYSGYVAPIYTALSLLYLILGGTIAALTLLGPKAGDGTQALPSATDRSPLG